MQEASDRGLDFDARPNFGEFSRRYETLLYATDLAAKRSFPGLLEELSQLLIELLNWHVLNYAVHDDRAQAMRVYMVDGILQGVTQPEKFLSHESPIGRVWSQQLPLIIEDLRPDNRDQEEFELFAGKGYRSLVIFPMTTARRLGLLSFGNVEPTHCDEQILKFLERIASLTALAFENSLFLGVPTMKRALGEEGEQLRGLAAIRMQMSLESATAYENLRRERQQLETIVEIQTALAASHLDLHQMFSAISKSLHKAVPHDASFVTLWEEKEQTFRVYAREPEELAARIEGALNAKETFTAKVLARSAEGEIVRVRELEEQAAGFPHLQIPLSVRLVSWCVVPMQCPEGLVGVFYIGSRHDDAFKQNDLDLLRTLAAAMGFFVKNAQARAAVQMEKERLEVLLETSHTLASSLDWKKLFLEISTCVRRLTAEEYAYLALHDPGADLMRFHALDFPDDSTLAVKDLESPVMECPSGLALRARQIKIFGQSDLERIGSEFSRRVLAEGIRKVCCVPLVSRGRSLGVLGVAGRNTEAFQETEIELLAQLAPQVAIALDNSRAYGEISSLKDKLAKEKIYLEQEISDVLNVEDMVGRSPALTDVLEQVKTVAASSATVLILGETGTGKELVARAIHKLSPRSGANFVKLNCAAIPTGLVESELFGHEKGAFTGAVSQKVGRLELADKGTLFLDEIGEIPLELQPKLLRVLQDQEFERLGGNRTIRVSVRLLAATNRDLSQAVTDHEFRADLYYRLHVFPVRLPALRDRPGDIPLLVRYFVQKFARRMTKQIESVPVGVMQALERWHWPGNIRELENFIERSVILTEGTVLRVPVGELATLSDNPGIETFSPRWPARGALEELERQYIVQVLRQTAGVISGSHGAAAKLGMKRTTLQSKIHRLGIQREEYGS